METACVMALFVKVTAMGTNVAPGYPALSVTQVGRSLAVVVVCRETGTFATIQILTQHIWIQSRGQVVTAKLMMRSMDVGR